MTATKFQKPKNIKMTQQISKNKQWRKSGVNQVVSQNLEITSTE